MAAQPDSVNELDRLAAVLCEEDEVCADVLRTELAACIDQTLLDPASGPARVTEWARSMAGRGFATLCVQPCDVERVVEALEESGDEDTGVCCVLNFPQGRLTAYQVAVCAADAVEQGATELDVVMNVGAYLEGDVDAAFMPVMGALAPFEQDDDCESDDGFDASGEECGHNHEHDHGDDHCHGDGHDHDDCDHDHDHDHAVRPTIKVIIETGYLDDRQICSATDAVSQMDVDFVKTSTGFGPRGATVQDVRLMCACVEPGVQVKAAGGIRTLSDAIDMLEAGATRLGTSHGLEILNELDALIDACGFASKAD